MPELARRLHAVATPVAVKREPTPADAVAEERFAPSQAAAGVTITPAVAASMTGLLVKTVPASKTVMGIGFHGFRQTAGGRAPLSFDDKPATKAAVLAGDLNVLTVSGLGGVSLLVLSRTKAAS